MIDFKNVTFPYLFNDRFNLLTCIGEGGNGFVFEAKDKVLQKKVAIKILSTQYSEVHLVRFQKEAKAIAGLRHPNIIEIFDFAQAKEGNFFLAMEYIDGISLEEYLEQNGSLEEDEALSIALEVLGGLEHAHKAGTLHRDIKPSNVMLGKVQNERRIIKLVDFGLAKAIQEEQELTQTGAVIGSPYYMSPEQSTGGKIDERTDVYSFGCLLFKMLTGKVPFSGEDVLATIQLKTTGPPPALVDVNPDREYSFRLEEIVGKCIATESGERYQSVYELKQDLSLEYEKLFEEEESELADGKQDNLPVQNQESGAKTIVVFGLLGITMLILLSIPLLDYFIKPEKVDTENVRRTTFLPAVTRPGTEIEASKIKPLTEEKIVNGRRVVFYRIEYKGDKLSRGAYQKILEISKRTPIYKVVLEGCDVDDYAIEKISKIKGLKELRLKGNDAVSPAGLAHIAKHPTLERLFVNQMNLSDKHIESLSKLESLTQIDLSENPRITDAIFSTIDRKKILTSFVTSSPSITMKALIDFVNDRTAITHLGIRNFSEGDSGIEEFARLKYVTRLDFTRTRFANVGRAIENIVKAKSVTYLELNLSRARGRDVLGLNQNSNIQHLSMDHCSLNDDDAFNLARLKHIRYLSLKSNKDITEKGLLALARNPNLLSLYMREITRGRSEHFDRKGLDDIVKRSSRKKK